MRSALINRASNFDDVREQLTGAWSSKVIRGVTVITTPFFTVVTGTMEAGGNVLPVRPQQTAMLKWAGKDSNGNMVVKAGQEVVQLPENAVVEMVLWKAPENSAPPRQ